ncbi:MAG: glutamate--tRNA ligase [Candidatus Thermoplasmatota archaeon]|nr:glutamate--tRNA ligase [Candidatus Thermoplasmatota archaeon]
MEEEILAFALQNALEHGGKANIGPVIGKAMALFPELRADHKTASSLVGTIVEEVNGLTPEMQRERLSSIGGPRETIKREKKTGLPDLEDAVTGQVVMRFAPGPSGPLHIGHTRAAILNDEYCKRYGGKFILRLEDTNPEKIDPEAYEMIPQDLNWLGVDIDEMTVQSDRFEIYYRVTVELIKAGVAYVCTTDPEIWREMKLAGKPVEDRDLGPQEHLERWGRMLDGTYSEGEASLVIKTDLDHRNPAVRDFIGMRIRDGPHPRTGDRYRVYPLYNLSVAIDDHLMGCTHILRGKDHLNNTIRQEYIYRYLGWDIPVFMHYGLVSIPESILKTSLIRQEIQKGNYTGWSDVRLGTLQALAARGFDPRALREYWTEVGIKSVDISFSWENLISKNRSLIDGGARRFFFVPSPMLITFKHESVLNAAIPYHPQRPELGMRAHRVLPEDGSVRLYVPEKDIMGSGDGSLIRLKDLCNVRLVDICRGVGEFAGNDISSVKEERGKIVQWVGTRSPPMEIYTPEGETLIGLAEEGIEKEVTPGEIVQLERIGYCRVFFNNGLKANMTHE